MSTLPLESCACDPGRPPRRPVCRRLGPALVAVLLSLVVTAPALVSAQTVPAARPAVGGGGVVGSDAAPGSRVALSERVMGVDGVASPRGGSPVRSSAPAPGLAGSRPDIVLLIVDDIAEMDLRVWQRLPTIRRLFLDQGLRFTRYFGNDPLCCPGRAALLTGQRTSGHGVRSNDARAFDPRTTIATELDAVGYHTIYAGKYFNATERLADLAPPGWDHSLVYSGGYWNAPMWKDGQRIAGGSTEAAYTTDVIRRTMLPWVRTAPADAPLFLVFSPFAVHSGLDASGRSRGYEQPVPAPRHEDDPRCAGIAPWRPPGYSEADRSDKPAHVRRQPPSPYRTGWPLQRICETLLSVDGTLAAVEQELRAAGRTDVLYILTADNGMGFGVHGWVKKRSPYATAMPLLMHWRRGLGGKPRTIRSTVANIDVAPTLCELAGCVMGPFPDGDPVHGLSLVPLLVGDARRLPREVLIEEHHTRYSGPRWVGVRTTVGSPFGRWVWTQHETGEEELYDLRADPWRLENLAGDPASVEIRDALAAELAKERDAGR